MVKVTRDHVIYAFSKSDKPAAFAEPGQCVELETYDCYRGVMLLNTLSGSPHTLFFEMSFLR